MNQTEHLLTCLMEECAEVAQRASKALRFGVTETQPGQSSTNAQRIEYELCDLIAVAEMLRDAGVIDLRPDYDCKAKELKKEKVRKFMKYAQECGTLAGSSDSR
jgi:NTP pyrophosphatase (non-canonical NTP hydrolase)